MNACSVTKKEEESSAKGHMCGFTPRLSKFRAFRTLHPPRRHVFLQFLVENKAFYLSKRALPAGTACHSWLK